MNTSHPYTRCIVISNTRSTNYARSVACITALKPLFDDANMLEYKLSKQDYTHPKELIRVLREWLSPTTLLCVAGGDGTNSFVINKLLTDSQFDDAARRAHVLPLWGGNANDLAFMANGVPRTSTIVEVVTGGTGVTVYPLHIERTHAQKTQSELGVCYASFGASAYASYLLNRPGHRENSLMRFPGVRPFLEARNVLQALRGSKRFICQIGDQQEALHDLLFINGSRIAKFGRAPSNIADKHFVEIRVRRKQPVVLSYIVGLLAGAAQKKTEVTDESFTLLEATWLQRDGEVTHIPSGTQITVRRSDAPFYLLSTKH